MKDSWIYRGSLESQNLFFSEHALKNLFWPLHLFPPAAPSFYCFYEHGSVAHLLFTAPKLAVLPPLLSSSVTFFSSFTLSFTPFISSPLSLRMLNARLPLRPLLKAMRRINSAPSPSTLLIKKPRRLVPSLYLLIPHFFSLFSALVPFH